MKKFWIIFFNFFFTLSIFSAWEKDYLLGLKKYEKKDCFEAIKLFEKAIKEKPNSCDKCIREGMFFYDYYPHFYLAKCYLSLNDKENFQRAIEFLKNEGKIENNSKLAKEFQILAQSIIKEEKIAEKEPEKPVEKKEEPKPQREEEIKIAEKKEEKVPEKPKEKPPEKPKEKPKEEIKEPLKPPPFPKIFEDIEILEEKCEKLEIQSYPRLEKKKMELSGEFIFLKKNWKEAKGEKEREIIRGKAESLKIKFEKLLELVVLADKIKNLKERLSERIEFFEKNKEKVSREDWKKIELAKNLLLKETEDLKAEEMEAVLKELSKTKLQEKKEYKNLKKAYIYYFEGNFREAELKLKNLPQEEKESPYFDFLFALLDLTKYYLQEKEDKNLLSQARLAFLKAKDKGLQKEEIKKLPISPKILALLGDF